MPTTEPGTAIVPWGEQFVSRRERREKRARRRFILAATLGPATIFGATFLAATIVNRPSESAFAAEAPTTTATAAPEWMAPTTTVLAPESIPTSTAPPRITPRVAVPGFDGLGKLITDGHRGPQILPGEVGRAVIGIPFDPSSAATVVVEGVKWTVFNRGQVGASDLAAVTGPVPIVPVVLIYSTLPGDPRPFVEAMR